MHDRSLPNILLVEPDAVASAALNFDLECAGYAVRQADGKPAALDALTGIVPELALFGHGNSVSEAVDLCGQLRRSSDGRHLPVLLLRGRDSEDGISEVVKAGVDDVLIAPFSTTKLLLRIRDLLHGSPSPRERQIFRYESIVLDSATRRVSRAGQEIHLRPAEFRLLHFLLSHPMRVFSREELLLLVWGGGGFVRPGVIDMHIGRLRKALNDNGNIDIIRTVRGVGYVIDGDTVSAGSGI